MPWRVWSVGDVEHLRKRMMQLDRTGEQGGSRDGLGTCLPIAWPARS